MALALLSPLAPVILVHSREPFERLVVILELVLGRDRAATTTTPEWELAVTRLMYRRVQASRCWRRP